MYCASTVYAHVFYALQKRQYEADGKFDKIMSQIDLKTFCLLLLGVASTLCNEIEVSSFKFLHNIADNSITILATFKIRPGGIGTYQQLGSAGRHESVLVQLQARGQCAVDLSVSEAAGNP